MSSSNINGIYFDKYLGLVFFLFECLMRGFLNNLKKDFNAYIFKYFNSNNISGHVRQNNTNNTFIVIIIIIINKCKIFELIRTTPVSNKT